MKAADGRAIKLNSDSAAPSAFQPRAHQRDYVEIFLVLLMAAAALLAFSLLLPDHLAQPVQALIGWGVAGAMGVLGWLVGRQVLKVLEAMLND